MARKCSALLQEAIKKNLCQRIGKLYYNGEYCALGAIGRMKGYSNSQLAAMDAGGETIDKRLVVKVPRGKFKGKFVYKAITDMNDRGRSFKSIVTWLKKFGL